MPTGYTYPVVEGKVTSFREFAMQCARAFGACIEMRDDPMDKPIPDEFIPGDHYQRSAIQAEDDLASLLSLTDAEKVAFGQRRIDEMRQSRENTNAKYKLENERIETMLAEVNAWEPPSSEHVGMKKFMVEQLEMSKHTWFYDEPETHAEPLAEYEGAVERARERIVDAKKYLAEEIERCESRTQWVRQLRESLKASPVLNG